MKIFADDTKAYSAIRNNEDCVKLQDSVNSLVQWTEDWLVRFNSEKCKVLHLGKKNPKYDYLMKEGSDFFFMGLTASQSRRIISGRYVRVLLTTYAEKDLGVKIDPELSFERHVNERVKKAQSISGLSITYKTKDIMVPLFKALIRPLLEYANVAWCPYLRKRIDSDRGCSTTFIQENYWHG